MYDPRLRFGLVFAGEEPGLALLRHKSAAQTGLGGPQSFPTPDN